MLVRVIVAIDEPDLRSRVVGLFAEPDVHVLDAGTRNQALPQLLSGAYDLAIVEGLRPDAEGRDLLQRLHRVPDRPQVVALLRGEDPRSRAELLAAGALAVLDAGIGDEPLGRALVALVAQRRAERLEALGQRRRKEEPEFISGSPKIQAVVETARRIAYADSPVLLLGETGVGKERLAAIIHAASPRSGGPFIAINCAAIPSELFESELFGHERGAFTGATRAHRGQFELAHEGTLFLDEVGEVPLHLQPKLLRALQEHRIRPVGADKEVEIDVRVIAATNRDLQAEMSAGSFRRDLYYRLAVVELTIPPLRERHEDIPRMAQTFMEGFNRTLGRRVEGFELDAMQALTRYAWPGNVRELVNVIERAALLCEGSKIRRTDLPAQVWEELQAPRVAGGDDGEHLGIPPLGEHRLEDVVRLPQGWLERGWKGVREGILLAGERAYLTGVLEQTRGRVGEAAKRAGMSPRALFEKMRRHGLRKEDFRPPRA